MNALERFVEAAREFAAIEAKVRIERAAWRNLKIEHPLEDHGGLGTWRSICRADGTLPENWCEACKAHPDHKASMRKRANAKSRMMRWFKRMQQSQEGR